MDINDKRVVALAKWIHNVYYKPRAKTGAVSWTRGTHVARLCYQQVALALLTNPPSVLVDKIKAKRKGKQ